MPGQSVIFQLGFMVASHVASFPLGLPFSSIVSDLGLSNMSHKRFQRHKRFHEPSVYSLKQGEL